MSLLFDELFAIRISLQEYLMDEKKIIKELKLNLINKVPQNEIDNTITDFYKSFGVEFPEGFVSEIQHNIIPININNIIPALNQINNLIDPSNNSIIEELDDDSISDEDDSDDESLIDEADNDSILEENNEGNISNPTPQYILNTMFDIMNQVNNLNINSPNENTNNSMEDVKVTLDEKDIEQLPVLEAKEDLNTKCCICMLDIEKDNKYCKLKCDHLFHESCIKQYFENFNYKCPICRKECGQAKYHI